MMRSVMRPGGREKSFILEIARGGADGGLSR